MVSIIYIPQVLISSAIICNYEHYLKYLFFVPDKAEETLLQDVQGLKEQLQAVEEELQDFQARQTAFKPLEGEKTFNDSSL